MSDITLCFTGRCGEILMEKKLTELPLKEDFIIQQSIKFFDDPEPCMIHRSAVMKRTYIQIYEFFMQVLGEGKQEVAWDSLPYFIYEALDIQERVQRISIR